MLYQGANNVHLILLGGNVQRSVSILHQQTSHAINVIYFQLAQHSIKHTLSTEPNTSVIHALGPLTVCRHCVTSDTNFTNHTSYLKVLTLLYTYT